MNLPAYQIGTTAVNLVSLESLGVPIPKASPAKYSKYLDLGDGTVRGAGWLTAEWRFAYLSHAQRAALKAYCSGSSAAVYVQTLAEDGTYLKYSAVMVWPQGINGMRADMLVDFVIGFRTMVAV